MEAVSVSETLGNVFETTRRNTRKKVILIVAAM
jgi:hypothetical protein